MREANRPKDKQTLMAPEATKANKSGQTNKQIRTYIRTYTWQFNYFQNILWHKLKKKNFLRH